MFNRHASIVRLLAALVFTLLALQGRAVASDYPLPGLDTGLEEMRPYWTGPQAYCRYASNQLAGATIVGGLAGAAAGWLIGGSKKGAVVGGVLGAGATAVYASGRKPTPGAPETIREALCGIARVNAEKIGYFVELLAERFGEGCGITENEFKSDPGTVFGKLQHCDYVEPDLLARVRNNIAYANHHACMEIRTAASKQRGAPAPTAQCPYASQPNLAYPIEETLANMSASIYALDDPTSLMLPIDVYQIVDQITDSRTGMVSALYRDRGSNYVVAFRGTVMSPSDLRNLVEDSSWAWFGANSFLQTYLEQAAKALVTYRQRNPEGHFVLTGHSLGGFAAMMLGAYTHLPAAGFNAPAGGQLVTVPHTPIAGNAAVLSDAAPDPDLTRAALGVLTRAALAPDVASGRGRSAVRPFTNSGALVNFRMNADWVSVARADNTATASRPYIGSICTILEMNPSLTGIQNAYTFLTSHDVGRTAAAMLVNYRLGGFFRPGQSMSGYLPCIPLE
jgi:hypothetical protein